MRALRTNHFYLVSRSFLDHGLRNKTSRRIQGCNNQLDHLLALYFSDCDDVSPVPGAVCSSLVRQTTELCADADLAAFCCISCFRCDRPRPHAL